MTMKDFEVHPELQDASLEKLSEMANKISLATPMSREMADIIFMIDYLRLNFTLIPRRYERQDIPIEPKHPIPCFAPIVTSLAVPRLAGRGVHDQSYSHPTRLLPRRKNFAVKVMFY